MHVRFTDVEDFQEELQNHPPPSGVVRLTRLYVPSGLAPNICTVAVVCGFVNETGDLVQLTRYVGEHWGRGMDVTTQTEGIADRTQHGLEDFCAKLDLDVRGGAYEHDEQ